MGHGAKENCHCVFRKILTVHFSARFRIFKACLSFRWGKYNHGY